MTDLPDVFRKTSSFRGCKAAIYVRISDTSGREDTLISDEIQIQRCTEYAGHEGMEIVKVVSDINLSGESSKKRQIASMIEEVRQGQYDVIIVWKWSRWGRNLQDSMINMALLQEAGGSLVAATEPAEVNTPSGRFTVTQFLAMAQLQLDQIREGWRDAHRNRLEKGLPHYGAKPYGYVYHAEAKDPKEKYTPHPEQFEVLREMYLMYLSGIGHRAIARRLNERGLLTNPGKMWGAEAVRNILDSGFGAGRITYNQKAKPGRPGIDYQRFSDNWPKAISMEEWERYLERREAMRDALPPRTAGQVTMLRGLVYCAGCKQRFSLTKYRQRRGERLYEYDIWRCISLSDVVQNCPCPSRIAEGVIIEQVRRWVVKHAKGMDEMPELVARKMRTKRAMGALDAIDKQIAFVKAARKKGVAMVTQGVLTEEEFVEQKEDYNRQIAELEEARAAHQREANVNAIPPSDAFGAILMAMDQNMDAEALNAGLATIIDRIEIAASKPADKRPRNDGAARVRIVPRWERSLPDIRAV